jgi:NitT/TauT family transport system ATP-binding protein
MDPTRLVAEVKCYVHPDSAKGAFFRDLHLEIRSGEITCLLGPSGVGKTTLLRILLGVGNGNLIGRIEYRIDNGVFTPQDACRQGMVGVLPQDAALVPWRTVERNLRLPQYFNPKLREATQDEIVRAIQAVGLEPEILKMMPHELSFGMRQRIALARSLLHKSRFLLLDEAFSGLDLATSDLIARVLEDYVPKHEAVCLLVTHDLRQAIQVNDKMYYLSARRTLDEIDPGETGPLVEHLLARDMNERLEAADQRRDQ